MASYTDTEKKVLLGTPIEEVMQYFGKDTSHRRNNMYFSPLRDEKEPSFHITPAKNLWYDFGLGEGGGVLDLVVRLSDCRRSDAMDIIAKINRTFIPSLPETPVRQPSRRKATASAITIDAVSDRFTNWALRTYLSGRGISLQTAGTWCSQLLYHVGQSGRRFNAIGFANDDGGWVIRSRHTKKCTSNGISSLRCGRTEDKGTVAVFEGFMDFLSWWEDNGFSALPCDVCVLNSVVNADKALPWITGHRTADLYLDNDEAGRRTTTRISDCCDNEGTAVNDMAILYGPYKDYNEMLLERRKDNCSTLNTAQYGNQQGHPGKTGQD